MTKIIPKCCDKPMEWITIGSHYLCMECTRVCDVLYQTESCPFNFYIIVDDIPFEESSAHYEMHIFSEYGGKWEYYDSYYKGREASKGKTLSPGGIALTKEYIEQGYLTRGK